MPGRTMPLPNPVQLESDARRKYCPWIPAATEGPRLCCVGHCQAWISQDAGDAPTGYCALVAAATSQAAIPRWAKPSTPIAA